MTHILIVDRDPAFILALREELEPDGYTVSSIADGAEALRADAQTPDLVLLEMQTPEIDGLQCCRALRNDPRLHATPVIFMSACSELADKLAAYEAGADDYLVKPFALPELGARLRAVLRRSSAQQAADGKLLQTSGLRLHLDKALVECESRQVRLTPMECELLRYLLLHLDQIVSSRRVLRELWQYPEGVGDPTAVRWHVKNLRRKIEPDPTHPRRLRTLAHHGYMLVSDLTAG